ncbi:glycosyltransferase, group 1 family protein [Mitsuokella sp. oral taxon 131 str. W9106]|nr:glycosyltransferase, group 1 family protein [Mitsuokella sp. oral taxon 131 str. W9106]
MLNVVLVNDTAFVNGGAAQIAIATARLLARHGHTVVFFAAVGPIARELEGMANLSVVCLNQYDILRDPNRLRAMVQGIWNRRAAHAFAHVLESFSSQDTIVHVHALSKSISSSIVPVAKRRNFRIVFHLHDYGIACPNLGFYDYPKKVICHRKAMGIECLFRNCDSRSVLHKGWRVVRQFVQRLFGRLPNAVDTMIYISEFSRRVLMPYFPKGQRMAYLPNWIDVRKTERVKAEKNTAFLFVGRLASEKAPILLARAAATLSVPAIFIGTGECEAQLRAACPHAEFPGWLTHEEMESYFRRARALVFPSQWYETMGLSVAEALARGIPSIVADTCAASDMIIDGETGELFTGGSLEALCGKMQTLSDVGMVKRLSEAAYQHFWAEDRSEEAYAGKLLAIYQDTLHGVVRDA